MLFAKPRKTELFVAVTMYNEDELLLGNTIRSVMRNVQHLDTSQVRIEIAGDRVKAKARSNSPRLILFYLKEKNQKKLTRIDGCSKPSATFSNIMFVSYLRLRQCRSGMPSTVFGTRVVVQWGSTKLCLGVHFSIH